MDGNTRFWHYFKIRKYNHFLHRKSDFKSSYYIHYVKLYMCYSMLKLYVVHTRNGFVRRDHVSRSGDNNVEFFTALSHRMDDKGGGFSHSGVVKSLSTCSNFPAKSWNIELMFSVYILHKKTGMQFKSPCTYLDCGLLFQLDWRWSATHYIWCLIYALEKKEELIK